MPYLCKNAKISFSPRSTPSTRVISPVARKGLRDLGLPRILREPVTFCHSCHKIRPFARCSCLGRWFTLAKLPTHRTINQLTQNYTVGVPRLNKNINIGVSVLHFVALVFFVFVERLGLGDEYFSCSWWYENSSDTQDPSNQTFIRWSACLHFHWTLNLESTPSELLRQIPTHDSFKHQLKIHHFNADIQPLTIFPQ